MSKITIETSINAPQAKVFDLARSIDAHKSSMSSSGEEAIAGITSGLINLNESVTWRAKHFGITQTLTSKITAMDIPNSFVDEMVSGAFKSFKHQHIFKANSEGTLMIDIFEFQAPLCILGKIFSALVLKKYMTKLLTERNQFIKAEAESAQA